MMILSVDGRNFRQRTVICGTFLIAAGVYSYLANWYWSDSRLVVASAHQPAAKTKTLYETTASGQSRQHVPSTARRPDANHANQTTTNTKTILFYNYYFHWKDYMFGLGVKPFAEKCGRSDCRTTIDKAELDVADVVVFYGRLLKAVPEIPSRRHPNQLFLYFNTEPAEKGYGQASRLGREVNLTVSYRHDSFIVWPYGYTLPKTKDDPPYVPLSEKQLASKSRPVAWMVSRCNKATTVRSEYVAELRKYIDVDIYGRCGNYSCPKYTQTTCMDLLEKKYKFYLAFENSICEDYITEKTFRTLTYNLVPVVMGGGNYTRDLPPHSFIDARLFSPKQLAEFLHHLDQSPQEYLKYFEWKHSYKIWRVESLSNIVFCKLCDLLHDAKTKYYSNFDVASWWESDHCIWSWEKQEKMVPLYHVYDS